jgi:hypothetical protein
MIPRAPAPLLVFITIRAKVNVFVADTPTASTQSGGKRTPGNVTIDVKFITNSVADLRNNVRATTLVAALCLRHLCKIHGAQKHHQQNGFPHALPPYLKDDRNIGLNRFAVADRPSARPPHI